MAANEHKTFQQATAHKPPRFPQAPNRTLHASSPAIHPTIPLQLQLIPQQVLSMQGAIGNRAVVQLLRQQHGQETQTANSTRLPEPLKTHMESLSGVDLSDVQIHHNSEKPAQLNALAYAQDSNIYLGAGQEQHLPHEAWHVVQQKQGRVKPTLQMKNGMAINNDPILEKEADNWGEKALQHIPDLAVSLPIKQTIGDSQVVQRAVKDFQPKGTPLPTIVGVLQKSTNDNTPLQSLDEIYQANVEGLKQKGGLTELLRAESAEATIVPEIGGGRYEGKLTEYNHVKALGKWEHLASTHTQERNLDTGHLIADTFFAPDKVAGDSHKKSESYVATNLAPQDSHINTGAYKSKETEIANTVGGKEKQQVKIKVDLEYGNAIQFPLKTLVDRGALKVLNKKQKEHESLVKEDKNIIVYRRLPSKWTLNIIDQKLVTDEGNIVQGPIKDAIKPYAFEQEHAFYDPEGKLGPVEILAQLGKLSRFTNHQKLQLEALETLLMKPDIQNQWNELIEIAKTTKQLENFHLREKRSKNYDDEPKLNRPKKKTRHNNKQQA